jgi:phosphohistidine phosphatase SixA
VNISLSLYVFSTFSHPIQYLSLATDGRSGYKGDITSNRSLCAAGPPAYIDALHDLSDDYVRVLIIGHNPGLEELVEMLTGEIHLMPTCSLVHVQLNVGVREIIKSEDK